jgi:hypothetical protein
MRAFTKVRYFISAKDVVIDDLPALSARAHFKRRAEHSIWIVLTLFHLKLCMNVLRGLRCVTSDETLRLVADMTLECYGREHAFTATVCWILGVLIGIGLPLLSARRVHGSIHPAAKGKGARVNHLMMDPEEWSVEDREAYRAQV